MVEGRGHFPNRDLFVRTGVALRSPSVGMPHGLGDLLERDSLSGEGASERVVEVLEAETARDAGQLPGPGTEWSTTLSRQRHGGLGRGDVEAEAFFEIQPHDVAVVRGVADRHVLSRVEDEIASPLTQHGTTPCSRASGDCRIRPRRPGRPSRD